MVKQPVTTPMTEQRSSNTGSSGFRRGVYFTGSASTVNIVLLFVETMIAVRLLSTANYGVYVLLIAVVNFFVVAVDFGAKTAVTQLIASGDQSRQSAFANTALAFRLLVIAVISSLIWLGEDVLLLLDQSRALLQFVGYIPLMLLVASFDELFLAMLQGFRAYHQMAVAQITRSVLRILLTIVFLVVLKMGIVALIYSWIISFAISSIYQYLVLPVSKRAVFQRAVLGEILRFGFPLQLTRFLWFAFRRVHVLLLGTLAGPASVAYFEVAARIPDALQRLSESYTAVYYPTVTSMLAVGNRKQAGWLLDQSLRLVSFATALAALMTVLFSRQIVTLLFSERYLESAPAFGLLMIGFHMTFIVNLMGYTLTAAGYPGRSLGENITRATVNILADLLLIPVFGFIGPACATILAGYMANPVAVWLLRRSDITVTVSPYVKQTLLLMVCAAFFWWIQPVEISYKLSMAILFVMLNVALSTISWEDFNLIVPAAVTRRLHLAKESLPYGR
jgi:O-antigen/teichoic acid export membrane protein